MIEKIENDLLAAMKSGESLTRDTLRMLKSALKNSEIEKGSALNDEEAIAVIQKEVKRRKEAIESYKTADKPDLATQEEQEAAILTAYLPAQMSEADVRSKVSEYLAANPTTQAEMGKAMGALSNELKGKADLGLVAKLLREQISPSA